MANVTINGPGTITGQFDYTAPDGSVITFYNWAFSVTVDGQVGVYTVSIDSNTDEAAAAADAVQDLEADPGSLGGIADGTDQGGSQDDGVVADGAGDGAEDGAGDGDGGGDGGGGGYVGDSA